MGEPQDAQVGLTGMLPEQPTGVAPMMAEHPIPGAHQRRDRGHGHDHPAVGREGSRRVAKDLDRVGHVLDYIEHHDGPRRPGCDGPGLLEVMSVELGETHGAAVRHRIGHEVEAAHFVSELIECDRIRPAAHPTLDQDPGRRGVAEEHLEDQLPLGNMPPVAVLDRDQFIEVLRIHHFGPHDELRTSPRIKSTMKREEGHSSGIRLESENHPSLHPHSGLTHHNSEAGLYRKFRVPSKPRFLPYSLATFR